MRTLRRLCAGTSAMAAIVLGSGAMLGLWVDREFLDSSNFASTARAALETDAVREFLSDELTAHVEGQVPAAATRFRAQIRAEIDRVVRSEMFADAFERAVAVTHAALVSGEVSAAIVDLSEVGAEITTAVRRIDPELEARTPDLDLRGVEISEDDGSGVFQRLDDTVTGATRVAIVLTAALLGVAFAMSTDRARLLRAVGLATAVFAAAGLLALEAGAGFVADRADRDVRDAVEAFIRAVLADLRWQGFAVVALALAAAGTGHVWSRLPRTAVLR